MAFHGHQKMAEVKRETDVTEESGAEWTTQDQSSHEGVTSYWTENNAATPVKQHDSDATSSLAVNIKPEPVDDAGVCQDMNSSSVLVTNIKSEPVEDMDSFPGANTEPFNQNGTGNTSQQFLSEPLEKTDGELRIKSETSFYVDVSSIPKDSWSEPAEHESWKNNVSKVRCKPFTCIELGTGNSCGDVKSEPVMVNACDIKTEVFDEHVSSNFSSDIKMEPVEQTGAETDTVVTGTCNTVSFESISCVNEDQDSSPGDDQEWDEPSPTCKVSRLRCPKASVRMAVGPDICSGEPSMALKRQSSTGPYTCGSCGKIFTHPSNLIRHRRIHTGERPFVCDFCEKSFKRSGNLKAHRMIHTGERPYACDVCMKAFLHTSDLKRHKLVHTHQRSFICNVCGKSFIHARNLKAHKTIHTEERSYVCDVCDKSFTHARNLTTHKVIHSDQYDPRPKPIVCDVCHKTFTRTSSLKMHMMTHTGERPYVCDVCSMAFGKSGTLKRHKMTHTRETTCTCDVCGKICADSQHLEVHKITHAYDD